MVSLIAEHTVLQVTQFLTALYQKAPGAEPERKREYHRDGKMSDYEVMTILILFHNSGYLMAGIAAYRFFPKKPMLQLDREINNQLIIF